MSLREPAVEVPASIQCPRCQSVAQHFKTVTADIAIFRCQGCGVAIYKNLVSGKTERVLPGPKPQV